MKINLKYGVSAALIGATIAIVQTQSAVAQSAEQVNKIAEQITVLIEGQNQGSGIIIAREGSTYYVLTAKHVVGGGAIPSEWTAVILSNCRGSIWRSYPLSVRAITR